MKQTRKEKQINKNYKSSLMKWVSVFLLPSFIFLLYSSINSVLNFQTSFLVAPKISQIFLPTPLEIHTYQTSVLGAQTIDPSDILYFVNLEREKKGVQKLRKNQILMDAAKLRAETILKHQHFSHQDPYDGIELVTIVPKKGYHYIYASENIGMGGLSGEDFVKGFLNSTSHRENMLNKELLDTGVAIVTGQYKQYYVNIAVQIFAIPSQKSDYLGYTDEDLQKYKSLLQTSEIQLTPLVWNIGKIVNQKRFNLKNYQLFIRQNLILTALVDKMQSDQPFSDSHVNLIHEFNWNQRELL